MASCNAKSKEKIYIIGGCIFVVICLVVLGIIELSIWNSKDDYIDKDQQCTDVAFNKSEIILEKEFTWSHWTYTCKKGCNGHVEMVCPSVNHDAKYYDSDDNLVMMTDKKIFSAHQKTYLKDCHGNIKHTAYTGSMWNAFVNGFRIEISFALYDKKYDGDKKRGDIIAYVSGDHFINNDIDVHDKYGNKVANLKRNKISLSWKWIIKRYNMTSPGADPVLLNLLAGTRSFDSDEKTDTCNEFFSSVVIIFICIACAIGVCVCVIIFFAYKKCTKKSNQSSPVVRYGGTAESMIGPNQIPGPKRYDGRGSWGV
jgi:hypothetical protein